MSSRLLALLLLTLLPASVVAQMPVDVEGTIVGVEGNRIGIRDGAGNIYQAEVTKTWRGPDGVTYIAPNAPSIMVTGTEDPQNLRPGQTIQFTATLSGRKSVVGEVTDGTLITLTPESRAGILNADPIEDAPAEDDDQKKPMNLEKCLIVGAVTKVKAGTVTVAAPGMKPLTFRFAEGTMLIVSGSDMGLARIGDKIKASGTLISLPRFATQDVKIEHSPAVDERHQRARPKPDDVSAKPGAKGAERENPFNLGDNAPAGPAKPKVKLELIKTN